MKSILLVDHDPKSLQMTENALQVSGGQTEHYRITGVSNADAAIARLKKETFDLVIADEDLPAFKGHELARWIHENLPDRQLPVILTSDDQKPDAIRRTALFSAMIRQGVITVFIPKPYGIQQFTSMVNLVLTTRRIGNRLVPARGREGDS